MNKARGETEITLGGYTFTACATMGALARTEGRLGKPLPDVLQDVSAGSYSACLVILQECASPADRDALEGVIAGPDDLANAAIQLFRSAGLIEEAKGSKPGK